MIVLDPLALARALGGEARGSRVYAPGPGHSKHDRSLSVLVDPRAPDGFLVRSFAGDDWRLPKDHVRERAGLDRLDARARRAINLPKQVGPAPLSAPPQRSDPDAIDMAMAIWRQGLPLRRTPAAAYLAGRGIAATDDVLAADALRYHAACPFGRERLPCVIALMRDIATDVPRAIHRTAIRSDGSGKASPADGGSPKRMLGPAGGCVVKLIADAEVTIGLGIAEGIENALSAICAGWSPVWAAGCKDALAKFPVLAGVEALTVFSDPEPRGVEAARSSARRWQEAGRETTVVEPNAIDSDLNDLVGHGR